MTASLSSAHLRRSAFEEQDANRELRLVLRDASDFLQRLQPSAFYIHEAYSKEGEEEQNTVNGVQPVDPSGCGGSPAGL